MAGKCHLPQEYVGRTIAFGDWCCLEVHDTWVLMYGGGKRAAHSVAALVVLEKSEASTVEDLLEQMQHANPSLGLHGSLYLPPICRGAFPALWSLGYDLTVSWGCAVAWFLCCFYSFPKHAAHALAPGCRPRLGSG